MADNFDKFRPDWTVGTLTLTGGSTAFTATNAELILAAIREGDAIITPSGFFLPIETLAEDGLTGTLSNPAPTAAAGTFDTRIRYQSDNSRFTGALLALTRQLNGGNLQSFGNLQGLQDLLPIFLGPGTVGLIKKSEVGIQDPNGNLGKLASSTAVANRSLQTDNANNIVFAPLGLELIASDTNNSEVAAWVKTGLGTTYREIFMFVDAAPVNAGGSLNIQLSSDNGASWLTATTEYSEQALVASGTNVTAVAPSSPGIGSGATAASVGGGGAIMDIKLGEFNQFRRTMYSAFVSRRANSGAMELVTRNGIVTPWTPFNAMRLVCSNGNLARFRVVLMGVRG